MRTKKLAVWSATGILLAALTAMPVSAAPAVFLDVTSPESTPTIMDIIMHRRTIHRQTLITVLRLQAIAADIMADTTAGITD